MNKTVVLYHGPTCADGFGSAWAAHTILGDEATYIPVQYGDHPPAEAFDCERLYVLDFSYPFEMMDRLARHVPEVIVLDHHRTARETLGDFQLAWPDKAIVRFDLDKSGAVLTWEHFHPGEPVPLILRYVQDRDLWRWKLPESREVSAFLSIAPREFEAWDHYHQISCESPNFGVTFPTTYTSMGRGVLAAQCQHVKSLVSHAFITDVGGHLVPAVNSPIFISEIGERLCQLHPDRPFAATFFLTEADEIWSLRSRGGFDVSEVARSLGGGGHAAAAGFRRPRR